jgi:hypothetical protein
VYALLETAQFKRIAMFMVLVMGLISFVPRVDAGFVPSQESFSQAQQQADMATVRQALENKMVQKRMQALGYDQEEIDARLQMLTDQERHDLASRINALNPGGDGLGIVVGVLVIILLVWFILYLTDKRIVVD